MEVRGLMIYYNDTRRIRCVLIKPLGSPGYKQMNRSVFTGYRA